MYWTCNLYLSHVLEIHCSKVTSILNDFPLMLLCEKSNIRVVTTSRVCSKFMMYFHSAGGILSLNNAVSNGCLDEMMFMQYSIYIKTNWRFSANFPVKAVIKLKLYKACFLQYNVFQGTSSGVRSTNYCKEYLNTNGHQGSLSPTVVSQNSINRNYDTDI